MTDHGSPPSPPKAETTRRQFLTVALLASAGAAAARLTGLGLRFYQPAAMAGEYGGVFDLGPLGDLPAANEPPLHHPEGRFYLVQTEAGLLALHKVCTHLDCLLGWDDQSRTFLCPCHGSQFAADGEVLSGPAARPLDRFVVRLTTVEGELVAETNDATIAPLAIPLEYQPEAGDDDASESGDDELAAEDPPPLLVGVDTGRKIIHSPNP